MDQPRFARIERLFAEALALPEAERAEWVWRLRDSEPDIAGDVARLVEHHREDEEAWTDLEHAIRDGVADSPFVVGEGATVPGSLGPYRILEELGRGGMGRVFLAERADVGKKVALKVVRGPFVSDEEARRFESEQRILARLEHPGIASLYDAGVADGGVPYFAMEVVRGRPITRFAREVDLDLEARLRLFLELCHAVAYAHANLVVHRDIKPGNVLVTDDRRVKLLDFGVAKLLDVSSHQEATQTVGRFFTPSYASPEQLRGERVTTATDVYQLGVVLYELLADVPPFDFSTLTPSDAVRVVSEDVPPPPSSRTGRKDFGTASSEASHARHRTLRRVRGDVDRIVLKCLEKSPDRRYGTADALSDDIRRFLDGRPVMARAGSPLYRARRFVRRHRTLTSAAVVGVAYALTVTAQNQAVTRERDRANDAAAEARLQTERAEGVTAFVLDLLSAADPYRDPDPSISVGELLGRGASEAAALQGQPDLQAEVLEAIGTTQYNLGLHDQADVALGAALDLYDSLARTEDSDPDRRDRAAHRFAENNLALGRHVDAEAILRAVLGRRSARPADPIDQKSLFGLGNALHLQGERLGADSAWTAWETLLDSVPMADGEISASLRRLGVIRRYQGDTERADRLLRAASTMSTEVLGPSHPSTGQALQDLANLMIQLGDTVGADTTTSRATEIARATYEEQSKEIAFALQQRATALEWLGALDSAEAVLRQSLEIEAHLSPNGLEWSTRMSALGSLLRRRGDYEEAQSLMAESVAWFTSEFGSDHLMTVLQEDGLARVLVEAGRFGEAEPILLTAHGKLLAARGEGDPYVARLGASLVRLYEAWGRPEQAAVYR